MKVRVDKDYCSDPVWICEDGEEYFTNGDLDDFNGKLSYALISMLKAYSDAWEKVYWRNDLSAKDLSDFSIIFEDLSSYLAKQCKKQLPEIEWGYWCCSKRTIMYV